MLVAQTATGFYPIAGPRAGARRFFCTHQPRAAAIQKISSRRYAVKTRASPSAAWFTRSHRTSSVVAFLFAAVGLFAGLRIWQENAVTPAPAEAAAPPPVVAAPVVEKQDPHAEKYQRLGEYLARRYRVSSAVATEIVTKAHAVGRRLDLDPMLILAVISVESRFNPIAESTMGAKGLMQVIPRLHTDKFIAVGGVDMAFELEPNITVGARILKEYMRHTGDLFDALQMYVGASSEENANEYSEKVTRERDRLSQIARRRADTRTAL
jgi:soluble lytic murein transglycosylase-like protein